MKGIGQFQGGNQILWRDHLQGLVEQLANDCHSPDSGRFCSTEIGSVGNDVSLSDLEEHHKERISGLRRMVGVIDSIHVMPDSYPKVSVEVFSDLNGAAGSYEQGEKLIKLAEDSPYNISTFVHEFGHHLSTGEFGETKGDFLSKVKKDPGLSLWLDAVRESETYKRIKNDSKMDPGHAVYLMDSRELFSRSYAQWVGVKAEAKGSTVLKHQHDKIREVTNGIYVWSDEEFAPIGTALEGYMKSKGLMR